MGTAGSIAPTLSQSARKDGAPGGRFIRRPVNPKCVARTNASGPRIHFSETSFLHYPPGLDEQFIEQIEVLVD